MTGQESRDYQRIALAIDYINKHFKEQPSLEKIAEAVGVSRFHFQRLFTEWAGVSPKKFIQYLSIEYAKQLIKKEQSKLLDVAYETGLSGTGRLHDLFINIEGMSPGELKTVGKNSPLTIVLRKAHLEKSSLPLPKKVFAICSSKRMKPRRCPI